MIPRISGTASRSQRLGITPRGMSEMPGGDQRMALPVFYRFAPAPDGALPAPASPRPVLLAVCPVNAQRDETQDRLRACDDAVRWGSSTITPGLCNKRG